MKSGLLRTALAVGAFAVVYVGFQLTMHRHTGILRALSSSRLMVRGASRPPRAENLKGTAPPHSVTLTWKPSPSPGARYTIYRRSLTGTAIRINAVPAPDTTFTDNSVTPGQTYFYTTRAINSAGFESPPSNEVRADIPAP